MIKNKQLGTQEDDHNHGDGQEEGNQKHKKMRTTMTMARKMQPGTQEEDHDNG